VLNVKKCMCWCLSIIELKNARWNIEIRTQYILWILNYWPEDDRITLKQVAIIKNYIICTTCVWVLHYLPLRSLHQLQDILALRMLIMALNIGQALESGWWLFKVVLCGHFYIWKLLAASLFIILHENTSCMRSMNKLESGDSIPCVFRSVSIRTLDQTYNTLLSLRLTTSQLYFAMKLPCILACYRIYCSALC